MFIQLLIGSGVILLTMAVMVAFISVSIKVLRTIRLQFSDALPAPLRFFTMMSSAVVLVLAANTLCVWIWAFLFRALNVFSSLEEAVYFSIVSFTTVGYGDLVVQPEWRVLSGFVSVNGLLAFGIFTAFIIEVMRRFSDNAMNGE